MKSGLLDKNGVEICDGHLVTYFEKICPCHRCPQVREYRCKIKFEYGGFYLLFEGQKSIYDTECSSAIGITLSQIAMHTDDHGDGYSYYLPRIKLENIEVLNEG